MKPFDKLKKELESLFEPVLKMQFCSNDYPVSGKKGNRISILRFYLKFNEEIIWDFPKDFLVKDFPFHESIDDTRFPELIREYLDTPLEQLLNKEFKLEEDGVISQYIDSADQEIIFTGYRLTELFKAADSRLGEDELRNWARKLNNPTVNKIILRRFGSKFK
jgi:hypothetical protein